MATVTTTDLGRVEDFAASALAMGRRAAAGLGKLTVGPAARGREVLHLTGLLTGERMFEPLGLESLEALERELRTLVDAETYLVAPCGWQDSDDDLDPVPRLTGLGRDIELVRSRVAETIRLARLVNDLIAAEMMVGKLRGFGG